MKLTKIKYTSSVFFGAIAIIFYSIMGILLWSTKDYLSEFGYSYDVTAGYVMIQAPLIAGFVTFIASLLAILVYNIVARKFPISWEVKK